MLHIESLGTLRVFAFKHALTGLFFTVKEICAGDLEIDRRAPAWIGQRTTDVMHVGYA